MFRYSVGSIGHIHYPMGSTIPGDTQTVAKLPDEGSPIGAYSRGRFRLLLCFAFFNLFFIYFAWAAKLKYPVIISGAKNGFSIWKNLKRQGSGYGPWAGS